MICNNCGCSENTVDNVQGVSYCTNCGMVLEENIIVSTINFTDDGVKSNLTGKIIDIESTQVGTQYVDASFYIKNTIRNICTNLGINGSFIDSSYRYYKLLLPYNLSKGKSLLYTLSAVIYINCRQEKTPHLLIDFSNALNLDVFKIGRSFSQIVEVLGIQIPQIDPSLYIQRFVVKLKLKNTKIPLLAVRIVSRMDKDWITTGRRPNNLCGAAILIASRVYNEERSINEIAKVVHVAESTIKLRLLEILNTKSSDLSLEEFNLHYTDTEQEEEPPVVKRKRNKKIKEIKEKFNDSDSVPEIDYEKELLTEEETKTRETIWNEMYSEYLADKEIKTKILIKPKRKRKLKQINTVSDVLKSLNKRISSKINYKAIENIFDEV